MSGSNEEGPIASDAGLVPSVGGATGPRTLEGKEKSKLNATTHGIFSGVVVLQVESRTEYESLQRSLREACQPEGALEGILVEKLGTILWRHRRLLLAEGAEIVEILNAKKTWQEKLRHSIPEDLTMQRLLRYEASLERVFDRTLAQLERLQRMRRGQPVAPPIKLDVTL